MSKKIKELIEFSELWWGSTQEGEQIAEDEILLVKDLIAALKAQNEVIEDLKVQSESYKNHFLGANDEADVLFKKVASQKVEIENLQSQIDEMEQQMIIDIEQDELHRA